MKGIQPDRERCYGIAVEQTDEPSAPQRNWGRLGLIAAGAVVVALVLIVVVRLIASAPHPELGETEAHALPLGACLEQQAVDLEEYTVIDCAAEHPQQVFGVVDLTEDSSIYTEFSAMSSYVDEVCKRYLEYGLFVKSGVKSDTYDASAIAVPTEDEFEAGTSEARCALTNRDGSALTADLYQRMP